LRRFQHFELSSVTRKDASRSQSAVGQEPKTVQEEYPTTFEFPLHFRHRLVVQYVVLVLFSHVVQDLLSHDDPRNRKYQQAEGTGNDKHLTCHIIAENIRSAKGRDHRYGGKESHDCDGHNPVIEDVKKFARRYFFIHRQVHGDLHYRQDHGENHYQQNNEKDPLADQSHQ
jgi:hypothetical protein